MSSAAAARLLKAMLRVAKRHGCWHWAQCMHKYVPIYIKYKDRNNGSLDVLLFDDKTGPYRQVGHIPMCCTFPCQDRVLPVLGTHTKA